jgi:hypothetical protein
MDPRIAKKIAADAGLLLWYFTEEQSWALAAEDIDAEPMLLSTHGLRSLSTDEFRLYYVEPMLERVADEDEAGFDSDLITTLDSEFIEED